jgi:hypothetical protein
MLPRINRISILVVLNEKWAIKEVKLRRVIKYLCRDGKTNIFRRNALT